MFFINCYCNYIFSYCSTPPPPPPPPQGINRATLERFGARVTNDRARMVFPVKDLKGEVVGLESVSLLHHLPQVCRERESVCVCVCVCVCCVCVRLVFVCKCSMY